MKHFALVTATALALTGVASAQETLTPQAQAAKEQLAKQIGVDPDAGSYRELVDLNCKLMGARNDAEKNRLLAGFGEPEAPPASGDTAVQLAAEIGVDPADFTLAQLVYMKGLIEGRNCTVERAASMAKVGKEITPSAASAKEQLGLLLGVDASDYTLDELVKMKWAAEGHPLKD